MPAFFYGECLIISNAGMLNFLRLLLLEFLTIQAAFEF